MPSRAALPRWPVRTAAIAGFLLAGGAVASEGLWPPGQLPPGALGPQFGASEVERVADRALRASVRIGGASGSLVSRRGLVLTNLHVLLGCVNTAASVDGTLYAQGFVARRTEEEYRCPGQDARVYESYSDETTRLQDLGPAELETARVAIEGRCTGEAAGRVCELVSLDGGMRHHLYRYRRYDDVRLVFAPNFGAAFYGGFAENFRYPRMNLDAAFVRLYENEAPITSPLFHPLAEGPVEGAFVTVAGYPFRTRRALTIPQLEVHRDTVLPALVASSEARLRAVDEFRQRHPDAVRATGALRSNLMNSLQRDQGFLAALRDPGLLATKRTQDAALVQAQTSPATRAELEGAWRLAGDAAVREAHLFGEWLATNPEWASPRLRVALQLIHYGTTGRLPGGVSLHALGTAAITSAPALEAFLLERHGSAAAEILGREHPYVRAAAALADPTMALQRSRLADASFRRALIDGGAQAIQASDDPLLAIARGLHPALAAIRDRYGTEVQRPSDEAERRLARLRRAAFGDRTAPDATATPRLSFGRVAGYALEGQQVAWTTTLGDFVERARSGMPGSPGLPPLWRPIAHALQRDASYNFIFTADRAGGNLGSAVLDGAGRLVGVLFDSNQFAFGTQYAYSDDRARAIAVSVAGLREALAKVFRAEALLEELGSTGEPRIPASR